MSLRVWLPLNGDIKNYGASDLVFSNNGVTSNASGKIGSCYYSPDYSSYSLISNKTLTLGNKQSMFCWVKFVNLTSSSSLGGAIVGQHRYPSNTGMGLTFKYVSSTTGYLSINTGTGSGRTYNTYCGSTLLQANTWYHVGYTYDGSTVKLYVNGVLDGIHNVGTLSNPADYVHVFAWSFSSSSGTDIYGGYHLYGYLNDVRIYDNVVSYDEVKDISRALVAYYPLDSTSVCCPNLISTMSNGGRTTLIGKYGLDADMGANADTYGYFNVDPALELGKTYTLSFDVTNLPTNSTWNWRLWNNANYAFSITGNGHWKFTFTPDASTLPSGYSLTRFLFDDGARTNPTGTVSFRNFKIEEGTSESLWCPHSSDSEYATSNALKAIDCSGYNRYGIIDSSAKPVLDRDGVRASGSYVFDGVNNPIKIPFNSMMPAGADSEFTMNVWFYHTSSWSSKPWETIFGGPSGFEFQAKNGSTNSPVLYAYSWNKNSATYELDKWNMLTFTRTSSESRFYLNGILAFTGTAGSIPSGNYFIGSWRDYTSQNYKGKMSAFSIYATALSADDISQEYHTYASIYNNQTLKACEFVEPIAANLLEPTNTTLTRKTWGYGLFAYTQSNCNVTLTDNGYRIYRDPNLTYSGNGSVMWGGLVIKPYDVYGRDMLIKGHTYILKFHVKGQSSNGSEFYWTNQCGWGGGGLEPSPDNVSYQMTPSNFQGEMECFYKWTINDDVWKVCTNSYSGFTAGNTYLSYRDFKYGFNYGDTGPLGTDLYITDIRMYDITAGNVPVKISTKGVCYGNMVEENFDKVSVFPDGEIYCREFIEV